MAYATSRAHNLNSQELKIKKDYKKINRIINSKKETYNRLNTGLFNIQIFNYR